MGIWLRGYLQELQCSKTDGNLEHTSQPAGCSAGWRVFFPGASVGLNLFQVAQWALLLQEVGLVCEC